MITEIKDKNLWNRFFDQAGSMTFLQSWEWGEFQKSEGNEIIRLGVYQQNQLKAIAQVIKIRVKRGNFLFLPHGPIMLIAEKTNLIPLLEHLFNYLIKIGKKENFSFIRVAPILENEPHYQQLFKNFGFKIAPIYMHAETTWQLPINIDKHLLMVNMRKTTRYLIKKAIREGVIIENRTDQEAVDDFYQIYQETAQRQHFTPFTKEYIKREFEAFILSNNALFLFARLKNSSYLSGALIIFTRSTAFYHQGASIPTKTPASYLLQWEAILEAKRRGCQFYNFWGIYDENSRRTPKSWQGLTLFKMGFGGKKIAYLPTQDYIIKPDYYLTYLWEKFLFLKRTLF